MKDLIICSNNSKSQLIEGGNYVSDDRFYTYINSEIERNLNESSKILKFLINYLYSSSNFKHISNISKSFKVGAILFDIFCIICTVGFFVCLGTGVLAPLINFIKNTSAGFIIMPYQIGLLVLGVFFMIIAIFYLLMTFRFKRLNKSLSLQVYVQKKINTILFWKSFIKIKKESDIVTKRMKKTLNIHTNKKEHHQIILLDNAQKLSMANIWLGCQLMNVISLIFSDIKVGLILRNIDSQDIESWEKIIFNDFSELKLISQTCKYNNDVSELSYSNPPIYSLPTEAGRSGLLTIIFGLVTGGALGGILGGIKPV